MTTALVLGGAGAIGAAVVRRLAAAGLTVRSLDVRETADLVCDVRDAEALSRLLEAAGCPDVVVWSVGAYRREPLPGYAPAEVADGLSANLGGLLVALGALLRARAAQAAPPPLRVVVVGSQAGATGGLDAVYAAAKAGCVAAVKSVAREYAGQGVTANVVSPGPVDTPMAAVMGERRRYYEEAIPLGRFATADEVADVVAWLATSAPLALTGAVVDVDGGLVRR